MERGGVFGTPPDDGCVVCSAVKLPSHLVAIALPSACWTQNRVTRRKPHFPTGINPRMMANQVCTFLSPTIHPQRISFHCALRRGWSRGPIPASEGITLPRHHEPVQSAALGRIPASLFAGTVSTMICVLASVKPNVTDNSWVAVEHLALRLHR
jgi:hypothetical protein